ncbi:hypothetical protein CRE_00535 [Caenorhabditis remanei]|uniref:Uncharacterized protein n=1 Tax=Caenorhabditis remanei TaxID=31234 RepID=E3LCW4_CAERE|nr:hypothetical protein CRE_00535 [Caenorhabditis remanei]
MKKVGIILQPITILLTVALLVLVVIDAYTYAWGSYSSSISTSALLSSCTPWNIYGCSQLWHAMAIRPKVGLIVQLCLIPLTITLIFVTSLAVLTRVIRKQTSIVILILISWTVFFAILATVILRMDTVPAQCYISGNLGFTYHNHWQIYITLASLIVSFIITQIFAFAGYFRPMITMLSFEGHYQRYDYPRISQLEKNMVSVKELDNF